MSLEEEKKEDIQMSDESNTVAKPISAAAATAEEAQAPEEPKVQVRNNEFSSKVSRHNLSSSINFFEIDSITLAVIV